MRPVRIANFSGFYGDRISAAREMLEGGPIDVLTGDYLAELTMMILAKARAKDPGAGYATTFLRQMRDVLADATARGVKIVVNAGGLNPAALSAKLRELGTGARIAHLEGDDLLARLPELRADGHEFRHLDTGAPLAGVEPVTANAYLGAWGVVAALERGADVVVCGRVTDAVLALAPAAWWHGWERDDWDRLAAGVVAGHVIECGAQATGGNYPFADELGDMTAPGFPIAEIADDGTVVITKHPGHGGTVSVGTVTAQLLYEIGGPRYANPDVVARFDTIRIAQEGPDRVRLDGIRGEPSPPDTKVCLNYSGGYRNTRTFVLTGLDVERKAAMTTDALFAKLGGRERFASVDTQLIAGAHEDPATNEAAFSSLRVTVKDRDPALVGRAFSGACVELALSSYAGYFLTTPPGPGSEYAVYWPTLVPAEVVDEVLVTDDGERLAITAQRGGAPVEITVDDVVTPVPEGPTVRIPLGTVAGARSGDKGGNANVGVWARNDAAYAWLRAYLTTDRLRELIVEARELPIERYELPNLRAVNFVLAGFLGEGVLSCTRMDAQAKSLGEYLRAKLVDVPTELVP